MTFVTGGDTKLIAAIRSMVITSELQLSSLYTARLRRPIYHGERILHAEALNMRLTEYVNTKWEEMIRDWRAVIYAKTEHDYAVAWSNFKPGNQGSFVNISMNHDI